MGTSELIEKIFSEARARVTAIQEEKGRLLKAIQDRAAVEEEKIRHQVRERMRQKLEFIMERARSQARLENRKILLEAKWRVVDSLCEQVEEVILTSPDYLSTLRKLAEKYCDGEAIAHFSPGDTARLGKISGVKIGEPVPITGGLIIRRGREEIDLSLDTAVVQAKDEVLGELNRILFSD